jgi:hypothetical protein
MFISSIGLMHQRVVGVAFGEDVFGWVSEHYMHVIGGLHSLCCLSPVNFEAARVCLSRSPGHGLQRTVPPTPRICVSLCLLKSV